MKLSSTAAALFGFLSTAIASAGASESTETSQVKQPAAFKPPQVFKNANLVHIISLEKNYVKEQINVLIQNVAKEPQDEYYVPFTTDQMARVGGFEVKDRADSGSGPFEAEVVEIDPLSDTQYYRIRLPTPLKAGGQQTLGISFYLLSAYYPLPAAIKQEDPQFLAHDFSVYAPSAYPTLKQKTEVKAASSTIPDYTKLPGSGDVKEFPTKQGAKLIYGPFDEKPAGAVSLAQVRFEFNKPVTHIAQLERDIEVSHWGGNIAFEERYELLHKGANLSVPFNRVKWAQASYFNPASHALKELKVPLQVGSVDAYFIDTIGNVSTSRFRNNKRESLLELKPRYPIFGGWKYPFTIGWNSDAANFLRKTATGGYILKVPFIEGPKQAEGVEYEQVNIRVLLPEGASNVKYYTSLPIPAILSTDVGVHKTYLDTIGRTAVTIRVRNIVDEFRDRELLISYDVPFLYTLRKPFIVFASVLGVYVTAWAVGKVEVGFAPRKAKTSCIFDTPPVRTPLTRKNLDAVERRCRQLEALLRSLRPEIDVETELKKLATPQASTTTIADGDVGSDGSQDDDYEWNEALQPNDPKRMHFKADGMAMAPDTTSGYLGSSSMSGVLKKISALLPTAESSGANDSCPAPGSIRVRSTYTPSPTLNSALASVTAVGRLIDAYFLFYNSSYPILHERTLRERWEKRAKISQSSSWVPICYMVLAIGQWVLGDESDENPYYSKARSWFSAQALECGTLGAVQAFLLMGNYTQKRDKPNTGYNFMGIAHRMAIGLGMHREITPKSQDTLALERRRQVFWTLSCFDSGVSITTGRPSTIIDAFVDVRLPRNIDDSDLDLSSPVPPEIEYPTTYSAIIAHSHLAGIANEIHTHFQSARLHQIETNDRMAVEMEEKLLHWRASLPGYFVDEKAPRWFLLPRAMLYWRARNVHILLWRGSQRHHTERRDRLAAGLKCSKAAVEAINEIDEFCKSYSGLVNIMWSWYATYFLFQAMLVLEVHRLEKRSTPVVSETDTSAEGYAWDEALEKGKRCLDLLNTPKSAAGRCLETLDRIHKHMAVNKPSVTPMGFGDAGEDFPVGLPADVDGTYGYFDAALNMNMADMQWTMAADPSLHMLLDGPQMDNLFRGVEGFPGTLDQESFDYVAGDLYQIRDLDTP